MMCSRNCIMEKFVEECGESEQVLKDWHSGFASAVELEFLEESAELEYEREYLLNSQPLRIDLLVIKKNTEADIQNCIGRIFKKYNVVEYKSLGDGLNIDVFLKVLAYAFLYKVDGKMVDERKVDEITVSLIREGKPNALFKKLKDLGFTITRKFVGVYWISGPVLLSV